tara:strand:- start:523 stop:801 length:279 start_codon:yes stop_codon:yes gene_type:complete
MEKDATCPKDMICFTEDEWSQFVTDYELDIIDEIGTLQPESTGDAQAVADFTWQVLFLTPWELAYIALPMGVLAFYGLSIYAMFKWIQKKFS